MLHAFEADNGEELFAYLPNEVIPKVAAVSSPMYGCEMTGCRMTDCSGGLYEVNENIVTFLESPKASAVILRSEGQQEGMIKNKDNVSHAW